MNRKHIAQLCCLAALLSAEAPASLPSKIMPAAHLAGAISSKAPTAPRPARKLVHAPAHRHALARTSASARVAAANRAATQEPSGQGFVNAGLVYPYAEGSLYHVLTAPGQVSDVALQPGEALGAVAAGDTVRWIIGDTASGAGDSRRTHVLVKPTATGLATNLVITTDRHVYHLSLTSTPRAATTAVSWTYPQDQLIALRRETETAAAAAPVASGLAVDQLHFGYAVSGDKPDWRPLRAFDDGRQTFIEFPPQIAVGIAPPLFVVRTNGAVELVNYRMRGHFYVVDRILEAAELRYGLKRQQIVRITRLGEGSAKRRAS